ERLTIQSNPLEAADRRAGGVERRGGAVGDAHVHAEPLRLLGIDGDADRTLPRVFSLLHDLYVSTGDLADVDAAADEQVDVQRIRSLGVAPCGHHQQRAGDVADAAGA